MKSLVTLRKVEKMLQLHTGNHNTDIENFSSDVIDLLKSATVANMGVNRNTKKRNKIKVDKKNHGMTLNVKISNHP